MAGSSRLLPIAALSIVVVAAPVSATDFSDVPKWHWAWCQVQGVCDAGVVQGYWDGTYRPADSVTRDQMAVYVARAFELPV